MGGGKGGRGEGRERERERDKELFVARCPCASHLDAIDNNIQYMYSVYTK